MNTKGTKKSYISSHFTKADVGTSTPKLIETPEQAKDIGNNMAKEVAKKLKLQIPLR